MEFAELKSTFLKTIVEKGYFFLEEIPADVRVGIPDNFVEKWFKQINTVAPLTAIPQNPRLVNRFTVGADPELTFANPFDGSLTAAMKIGLNTGLAFGMDNNGRLAELRPQPSRFVLDIVASVLAELKWMAVLNPNSLQYNWMSNPWDGQDGVGGHVHLARKLSEAARRFDSSALTNIYSTLLTVGTFNKRMNDYRTNKTKYGSANDVRLQKHGYEFRAFPTWLDSPWLAYLVLVLSKLAVLDSKMIYQMYKNGDGNPKKLERSIVNLLGYYKNVDDDAWIAYTALKKWGLPKQLGMGGDFKTEWGIVFPQASSKVPISFYPSIIKANDCERQAIFDYLVNKKPIRPDLPECNWEPKELPKGYLWNMSFTQTYHKLGIGEIVHDLACHGSLRLEITTNDQRNIIQYENGKYDLTRGVRELAKLIPGATATETIPDNGEKHIRIWLPSIFRQYDTIPLVRKVLTSGLFPIWNVKDVKEGCFEDWVRNNEVQPSGKFIGKELNL